MAATGLERLPAPVGRSGLRRHWCAALAARQSVEAGHRVVQQVEYPNNNKVCTK